MTEIIVSTQKPVLDTRPLRHRVGLIALATDHTSEVDYARMLVPQGVGLYTARIPYANPVTPETLRAMAPELAQAAALILPDEALDAVIYGCTSASVCIGDAAVTAAIRQGKPDVAVVTPISATLAGLRAFGAKRISVLTPYSVETSRPMADLFEVEGFGLDRFTCLDMDDDREMARISLGSIIDLATQAVAKGSEALFISCTAVRAAGVIAEIEAAVGIPVLSSNYAGAWQVLRLLGDQGAAAPGRLMQIGLAP
ncbi:ectoine utilization protein EutA [Pseudorhodobacter sp.]|uniref:ectoine utilization protein EutA n=1 Tax=Pseudorhodobacter sp. TaxID=1934400 RepID=UPI0026470D36|nr:ectoine utilization protein EutA [Pseudorhodobacter sp.]MDN5786539.1 ectoine utilization protein EutA [Pseudorhodobacter sp.]